MTADHAGQTGGEREVHLAAVAEWYRRRGCCGELFGRTAVCSEPRNHKPISAAMGWLHAEDFLMRDQAERALASRPVPVPGQPDEPGVVRAREQLAAMRRDAGRPARLGCQLSAHRDLGFCASCASGHDLLELVGWRLLAIVERGVPAQPVRDTQEGRR